MAAVRKRVLFIVPSLIAGGAQRVFSTLLRHLDRSRFEPHLAMVQARGEYLQDVAKDVVIHDLNVSRVRYAAPAIVRVIWKVKPQAVLATLGHVNLSLMAVKPILPRGTRLLIREASLASAFLSQGVRHPAVWKWFYRYLYRRADKIVCLSDAMVEDMAASFDLPRTKLVRIYNPVDIQWIRKLSEEQSNPYSGKGPHLVTVGRLCREKGYDILLAAMPRVLERFPGVRLTIVGEGELERDLKQQVDRLGLNGSVCFTGFQQNPWRYVRYADLFILSSRVEGMPNALLESLALGTPVIAADCTGAIREIQNSGEELVLVPPENQVALAAAIISACVAPRRHQSAQDLAQFSVPRIVEAYSNLF
jgi:glycosyltransferase involved in cell wall biosynthesis